MAITTPQPSHDDGGAIRSTRLRPTFGTMSDMTTHGHHHDHGHDHSGKVTDPVCGMKVDPAATPHHADHAGHEWHFCSDKCRTKFIADPEHYLAPQEPVEEPPGTIWTCPMHPEVRQDHPGACPICGMALEPAEVGLDSGPSPELIDMTRRFWIGLVLALPVLVLEMGGHKCGPGTS